MLIYAVIAQVGGAAHRGSHEALIGPDASPERIALLSPHLQVTGDTPPMFLAHAKDDMVVPFQNSVLLNAALRARGVSSELHLYEEGGHGFGLGVSECDSSAWPAAAESWLERVFTVAAGMTG
jgi:dipeptidyl aminopeptidase/acylaminoacyl peptidase